MVEWIVCVYVVVVCNLKKASSGDGGDKVTSQLYFTR